jgi:hypothetical protein
MCFLAMSKPKTNENLWVASQRKVVEEYLKRERVQHLGVGDYPAFHVCPYFAVWVVQSKRAPGRAGWWAISGDLPTDYVSRGQIAHPREALRAFARKWREVSEYMLLGKEHPQIRIGRADQRLELGDLLRRRAQILQSCADDDAIWDEGLVEQSSTAQSRRPARQGVIRRPRKRGSRRANC